MKALVGLMFTWLSISFIVGIVLGLTGSGGGLVSIPLFMNLVHIDLKVATVFSLLTVMIGALFGWLPQRRGTHYIPAAIMFSSSLVASWGASHFKSDFPEMGIRLLIVLLCCFSLYQFWKGRSQTVASQTPNSTPTTNLNPSLIVKSLFTGIVLGVLTTLTGLGGGVLLVPLMLSLLKFTLPEAISTSLLTVMFASAGSLWFQREQLLGHVTLEIIGLLILGVVASSLLVRLMLKKIPTNQLTLIKKIVFTSVVIWTIVSVIGK